MTGYQQCHSPKHSYVHTSRTPSLTSKYLAHGCTALVRNAGSEQCPGSGLQALQAHCLLSDCGRHPLSLRTWGPGLSPKSQLQDPDMSWEQQKRVILPFLQVGHDRSSLFSSCHRDARSSSGLWAPHGAWASLCIAQRAEEIEKVERKVAYYCRLYAVDQVRCVPLASFLWIPCFRAAGSSSELVADMPPKGGRQSTPRTFVDKKSIRTHLMLFSWGNSGSWADARHLEGFAWGVCRLDCLEHPGGHLFVFASWTNLLVPILPRLTTPGCAFVAVQPQTPVNRAILQIGIDSPGDSSRTDSPSTPRPGPDLCSMQWICEGAQNASIFILLCFGMPSDIAHFVTEQQNPL